MESVELVKFEELAAQRPSDYTRPPYRVPSKDLDKNFRKLRPIEQKGNAKPYSIYSTDDGWQINPEAVFYVCVNGKAQRFQFVARGM